MPAPETPTATVVTPYQQELDAMAKVAEGLDLLNQEQRHRVLQWAISRYANFPNLRF